MRQGQLIRSLLMIGLIAGCSAPRASAGFFSLFGHDDAAEQSGNGDNNRRCWFCPPDAPIRPIANAIGVRQQAALPEEDDADLQSQAEDLDERLNTLERDLTRLTLIVESVLGRSNPEFRELFDEPDDVDPDAESIEGSSTFITPQDPRTIARPPAPPAELEFVR